MNEPNQKSRVCEICSKICRKKENRSEYLKTLIQHFREKHGETLATAEGGKSLTCFVCDKRFRNEVSCKLHILDKHHQYIIMKQEQKTDDDIGKHQPMLEIKAEIKSEPTSVKHEYFEETVDVDLKPVVSCAADNDKEAVIKLEETCKEPIYSHGRGDDDLKAEDKCENYDNDIKREMFSTLKEIKSENLITLKNNIDLFKPYPGPFKIRNKVQNPVKLLANQYSAVPNSAQYSILRSLPPPQYQYIPPCQYRQAIPPPEYPGMAQSSQYPAAPPSQCPVIPPNQYPVIPTSQYSVPPPGFPCMPPPQLSLIHPSQYPLIPQDLSMPPPPLPLFMPPPLVPVSNQCPTMPPLPSWWKPPYLHPSDRYRNNVSNRQVDLNQFGSVGLNQAESSYWEVDHTRKLIRRVRRERWVPY